MSKLAITLLLIDVPPKEIVESISKKVCKAYGIDKENLCMFFNAQYPDIIITNLETGITIR